MLFHIRPRLYSPFRNVSLIDLAIEPLGLLLVGGEELRTGRPYTNKGYAVACRKQGHKAMDGILIETETFVDELRCTARWAVEADFCVTHSVDYKVLDRDFDAASDSMILWHACCEELGGWSNRVPLGGQRNVPLYTEPLMEVVRREGSRARVSEDTFGGGCIVMRRESFGMPTIERDRILRSKLNQRLPSAEMIFRPRG